MMQKEKKDRRPRGPSARGNFETAKVVAVTSEEERVAAARKKSALLREPRIRHEAKHRNQST